MLKVAHTPHTSTGALLGTAIDTLEHYGFVPAEKEFCKKGSGGQKVCVLRELSYVLPHERKLTNLTKACIENELHGKAKPRLIYNFDTPGGKRNTAASLGMHIIGSNSTVAEVTVISAINTLLKTLQVDDFVMHINSIGDRESKKRFVRDLSAYLRGIGKDLPTYARTDLEKKKPLLALIHLSEREHPIARTAPNPMEYLNDESRGRLREILEYMENAGINYELNPALVGSSDCWSHTLFEVKIPDGDVYVPIVCGGRYNTLARRAFGKKLASVGAIMEHEIRGRVKPAKRKAVQPKFFMCYLGSDAKMRSFALLEDFYQAGIPIGKSIAHEHIGEQIKESGRYNVPYLIIIGHKEALEDTAIVRNTHTRVQKVVPTAKLISYLSRLKV